MGDVIAFKRRTAPTGRQAAGTLNQYYDEQIADAWYEYQSVGNYAGLVDAIWRFVSALHLPEERAAGLTMRCNSLAMRIDPKTSPKFFAEYIADLARTY